jgi:hypothetical protein
LLLKWPCYYLEKLPKPVCSPGFYFCKKLSRPENQKK